jgi:hypothetical protein
MPSERNVWPRVHRDLARAGNRSCRPLNPQLYINRSIFQQREHTFRPGAIRHPKLPPTAPFQFRSVPLDPTPNRNVIYAEVTLGHEFFQVPITKGKPKIMTTHRMMISGSKCLPLNSAGRSFGIAGQRIRRPEAVPNTSSYAIRRIESRRLRDSALAALLCRLTEMCNRSETLSSHAPSR